MYKKITIAEDNSFLLKAIEEKLSFFSDLMLKFTAQNGKQLIGKLAEDHKIDIILMDIQMPEMDGIETTRLIKTKYPQIKIIMLTVLDDDDNIFKAIQAGADGYLLKETDPETLHKAILDVLSGGAAMTPSVAQKTLNILRKPLLTNTPDTPSESITLTNREVQVLEQLASGLNYQKIADNLIISPKTVRKHIENIYTKLQVHNKVEAIQKGIKHRLI